MSDSVNVRITATDDASEVFKNAAENAKTFGIAIGTVFGAAATAIAAMVKQSVSQADALFDMSQRTGLSIEKLASYKLAAEQSGTSLDSLGRGIKNLSVLMQRQGDAFRKAGIDTLDTDKALRQIADMFKSMPAGIEKTALAVKLFGEDGTALISIMNRGSKGLDEAEEKSTKYSAAMKQLAPDVRKFNESMREMSLLAEAAAANIAGPLVSAVNSFLNALNAARVRQEAG